ncbi:MAG: DUF5665 domain-containing protein [Parcubacteria group bacterium]
MEEETKILSESVDQLSVKVDKLASLWRSFLQGIFFGLGSAIGASIIAVVLFGAFNWFLHSVNSRVPALKSMENVQWQK